MPASSAAPARPRDPKSSSSSEDTSSLVTSQKNNALQGTSAAGARALGTQVIAFYFRAPVKSFFRMRVDYMQVARALHPTAHATEQFTLARLLRQSTIGLLTYSVRRYGWGFIPRQVLPPLIANASVGAILYTSYLSTLGFLHQPSSHHQKRVYPPPSLACTFTAGAVAGGIQSVVAAPLDALVVRFNVADMLHGEKMSIWKWSAGKLREIGARGVFAGWSLSFLKEAGGYGCFFASFEFIKAQGYFTFLTWYYRKPKSEPDSHEHKIIRPHYAIEPIFLLLAGVTASITQQLVQYPVAKIQEIHYARLESIDYASKLEEEMKQGPVKKKKPWPALWDTKWMRTMRVYRRSYSQTFDQCAIQANKAGGWRGWLFKGLLWNTVRQIPSTAAGLVVFELMRRKMGVQSEEVTIEYEDRTIILS